MKETGLRIQHISEAQKLIEFFRKVTDKKCNFYGWKGFGKMFFAYIVLKYSAAYFSRLPYQENISPSTSFITVWGKRD